MEEAIRRLEDKVEEELKEVQEAVGLTLAERDSRRGQVNVVAERSDLQFCGTLLAWLQAYQSELVRRRRPPTAAAAPRPRRSASSG